MNFVTKILLLIVFLTLPAQANAEMREQLLKDFAKRNGLVQPEDMIKPIDDLKSVAGKILFESDILSLNSNMSCKTCHLDKFSSADGLPNAIGVGGKGEGKARLHSNGAIVPRNTLPLWGRGSIGFETFFWDGKVQKKGGKIISQFGLDLPSSDALEIAVHLPFVEIREMMVDDDQGGGELTGESTNAARKIYDELTIRVRSAPDLSKPLTNAFNVKSNEIEFRMVASAISEFIRDRFQIRQTRLHDFVFGDGTLTAKEITGGILFYGKGRCSLCHNGPMFTDQKFHAIAFPQIGFGKNGFGRDFGRYNVTFDPEHIYQFRTPPLYNVERTAPYSHSGSVFDLANTIRFHFDPLQEAEIPTSISARQQFYGTLKAWSRSNIEFPVLDSDEMDSLVDFLKTLSFETPR